MERLDRVPARRWLAIVALVAAAGAVAVAVLAVDRGNGEQAADGGGVATVEPAVIEAEPGAFNPRGIYERVSPGVVTVLSTFGRDAEAEGGLFGGGPAAGQGSGFVLSTDGEIVTNAHVVTDAQSSGGRDGELNEADNVFVEFADRNRVPADVVGVDAFADVALLKVDPDGLDLRPLRFADSDAVGVGDAVAAIGSPFGQEQSLSIGVVSATDRSIESLTRFQIDGALQTDASINPGNSGGPLLDVNGRVIGINQQINTTSGGDEGVGFAVPSNLVERSVENLHEEGKPAYAYIGVTSQPLYPQLAERLDLESESGSLIARVVPGSPADEAELRAGEEDVRFQGQQVVAGGDVILSVDGKPVVAESDLPRLISRHEPGEEVTLEILRDGDRRKVDVTLAERPTGALR
jgi:S1-C subfamily serine protease